MRNRGDLYPIGAVVRGRKVLHLVELKHPRNCTVYAVLNSVCGHTSALTHKTLSDDRCSKSGLCTACMRKAAGKRLSEKFSRVGVPNRKVVKPHRDRGLVLWAHSVLNQGLSAG